MKTQFILPLFIIAGLTVFTASCYSQEKVSMFLSDADIPSATSNVNTKAIRSFMELFPAVKEVKWLEKDNVYITTFMTNEQTNKAVFRKNGLLVYHTQYGFEKHLPAGIRKQIKTHGSYFDYSITRTIRVNQDDRDIWIVYLEDEKTLILVRIENNELQEVKHYQKPL